MIPYKKKQEENYTKACHKLSKLGIENILKAARGKKTPYIQGNQDKNDIIFSCHKQCKQEES